MSSRYLPQAGHYTLNVTDIFTRSKRSSIMRAVRSQWTEPELALRRTLKRLGIAARSHVKTLPGTPDFVLTKKQIAIFVHGCFWHGHAGCARATLPSTRKAFWRKKILGNLRRDRGAVRQLRRKGFRVVVLWSCQLAKQEKVLTRLAGLLN